MSRPLLLVNNSSSTGTFGGGYHDSARFASVYVSHDSTAQTVWNLEGSAGASGVWTSLIAATSSTGNTVATSTGGQVFDRVRVNVTTATTDPSTFVVAASV